jgi:hypothetical protein
LAGETVPDIHSASGIGSLTIRVTEASVCGTVATAAIDREGGALALVLHVSGDPTALCGPVANTVVDYTVTINGLPSGTYRVDLFQGLGDGTPVFLGSASAAVQGGVL